MNGVELASNHLCETGVDACVVMCVCVVLVVMLRMQIMTIETVDPFDVMPTGSRFILSVLGPSCAVDGRCTFPIICNL